MCLWSQSEYTEVVPSVRASKELSDAVAKSFLNDLSERCRAQLITQARVIQRPPGHILIGGHENFSGIVVSGLLRVYTQEGGEALTWRNTARGEAVGLGTLLGEEADVWVQVVSMSTILAFDLASVAELRRHDLAFNQAVGREAFRRLRDQSHEFALRIHGSVIQRTARHLLDLAAEAGAGDPVTVNVTHERVADSIGSRREVITRAFGQLQKAGVVSLRRGRIVIREPLKLHDVALGR